jgi:hypothetical protein
MFKVKNQLAVSKKMKTLGMRFKMRGRKWK